MFETDSFSPYVITIEKLGQASAENASSAPEVSETVTAPSDGVYNPYTGSLAMVFAPIAALAAVTVAAVSKKKK